MVELGDKVRDKYSGLVGIAVVRSEFINGCIQFEVQPKAVKDGKLPESIGIDEGALEVINKVKVKKTFKVKLMGGHPGGPNSPPIKMRGY